MQTTGLEEAIRQLLEGLSLIGNAINVFVRFILSFFGVEVPDLYLRLATIVVVILTLWKLGSTVGKIVRIALIILLVSQAAGLLTDLFRFL